MVPIFAVWLVFFFDLHLPTAGLSVVVWESIQPASFGGNQAKASRPIGLVEREGRRSERA